MQSPAHICSYHYNMATAKQQHMPAIAQLDELPASFLTSVVLTLRPLARLALFQCSTGCMLAVASSCEVRLQLVVGSSLPQPSQRPGLLRLLALLAQPNQHLHLQVERQSNAVYLSLDPLLRVLSGDSHAAPNTARVTKLSLLWFTQQIPQLLTPQLAMAFPNLASLRLKYTRGQSAALLPATAGMPLSTATFPNLTDLIITRKPNQIDEALNQPPPANVYEHSWPSSQQLRAMLPNLTSLELRDTTQPPLLIPAWSDQLTALQLSCYGLRRGYTHPALDQITTCHKLVHLLVEDGHLSAVGPHLPTKPGALDNLAVLYLDWIELEDQNMELLLQLPQLRCVTAAEAVLDSDFSQRACKWKRLNLLSDYIQLLHVSRLPLHSLTCPLHFGYRGGQDIWFKLPALPLPQSKAIMQKLAQQLQHVGMSFNCRRLSYGYQSRKSVAPDTELAELLTILTPCMPSAKMATGAMHTRWLNSDGRMYVDIANTPSPSTLYLRSMKVGPTLLSTLAAQHKASVRQLTLYECEIEGNTDEFWAAVLQFPHLHDVYLTYTICEGIDLYDHRYGHLVNTPLWITLLNEITQTCLAIQRQLTVLQHQQQAGGGLETPTQREHAHWRGITIQLQPVPFTRAVLLQACRDAHETGEFHGVQFEDGVWHDDCKATVMLLMFLPCDRCLL